MSDTQKTPYTNKCDILGELWLSYKQNEDFEDFFEYNDLGLPLAYAISAGIVKSTPEAEIFVNETFDLLLGAVGRESDEGFESIEDVFAF